jgi:hypothetical protein
MNSSVWAAQGSKEKNVDLSFSEQLFRVVFSTFCGQNNEFKIFLKYCRVRTKKLLSMKVKFILF